MGVIRKFLDEYVRDVTSLGGLPLYGIVFLFFVATAKYSIALNLLEIFLIIMIVTYAIKSVYFRARPDNVKKEKGRTLLDKADLSSFPSVHSARITALGVYFSMMYSNVAVTIVAAVVIAAVCVSRVMLKRHYITDVAAGFVLGLAIGYAVFVYS